MPEHYTKNTLSVSRFCKTCNRMTMFRVDNGRLGPCLEEHAKEYPKKKVEEDKQESLFPKEPQ